VLVHTVTLSPYPKKSLKSLSGESDKNSKSLTTQRKKSLQLRIGRGRLGDIHLVVDWYVLMVIFVTFMLLFLYD